MRRASLASAILLAAGAMAAMAGSFAQAAVDTRGFNLALQRSQFGRAAGVDHMSTGVNRTASGWTNARYQRAARKARNVKRNRRAHRG